MTAVSGFRICLRQGVLHFPEPALLDERVVEGRQHADLQARQPVEKSQPKHVQLQESQHGAKQQPGPTRPFSLLPPVPRRQRGVRLVFAEVLVVGPKAVVEDLTFESRGSLRLDDELRVYATLTVSAPVATD